MRACLNLSWIPLAGFRRDNRPRFDEATSPPTASGGRDAF